MATGNDTRLSSLHAHISHEDWCSLNPSLSFILPPIRQCVILRHFFKFVSPSFWVYATVSFNHGSALLPHPHHPSLLAPLSFIHILLLQQQQTESFHRFGRELLLIIIFPSASICIPLAFLPLGDFTFISSSFTLYSSLCVGAFLSLPSVFFTCAPHCTPFSSSSSIRSLHFLYFSFVLFYFFFRSQKSCNEVWQTTTLLP